MPFPGVIMPSEEGRRICREGYPPRLREGCFSEAETAGFLGNPEKGPRRQVPGNPEEKGGRGLSPRRKIRMPEGVGAYTTDVASISTKNSGKAKRVTPTSVLAG